MSIVRFPEEIDMGLGGWFRRVFGGKNANTKPAEPLLRLIQSGRVQILEIPNKPLADASVRRAITRELTTAIKAATGVVAIDFRIVRVISHLMREPLTELSQLAQRRKVKVAFIVRDQDQREFFSIIQLDKTHEIVFEPNKLATAEVDDVVSLFVVPRFSGVAFQRRPHESVHYERNRQTEPLKRFTTNVKRRPK